MLERNIEVTCVHVWGGGGSDAHSRGFVCRCELLKSLVGSY